MKELIVYQVDSFTKEKFKGNPAGVVLNADGLTDEQMQHIARELNNSETAFLFPADDQSCDGVIRYFSPRAEVPICGHATIAAMYAKAIEYNLDTCTLRMKTNIGVLPFTITKTSSDYLITMTQGKFEFGPNLDVVNIDKLVSALGLLTSELDETCPVQIVSTGHSKVMIGIKSRQRLNSLLPDFQQLTELSENIKCNGYFVFTFDSDGKGILVYGRMFAPAIGINEDPVTGNAFGPLAGYLVENSIIKTENDIFEFTGRQGEAIKRLREVAVKTRITNGKTSLIQITGNAAVAFKTHILI